jgi:hypothetical protein
MMMIHGTIACLLPGKVKSMPTYTTEYNIQWFVLQLDMGHWILYSVVYVGIDFTFPGSKHAMVPWIFSALRSGLVKPHMARISACESYMLKSSPA